MAYRSISEEERSTFTIKQEALRQSLQAGVKNHDIYRSDDSHRDEIEHQFSTLESHDSEQQLQDDFFSDESVQNFPAYPVNYESEPKHAKTDGIFKELERYIHQFPGTDEDDENETGNRITISEEDVKAQLYPSDGFDERDRY